MYVLEYTLRIFSHNWYFLDSPCHVQTHPSSASAETQLSVAFGHIAPKYAHPLDRELFLRAIERTSGGVDAIYVDWKGTKGEMRQRARELADQLGLEFIRD